MAIKHVASGQLNLRDAPSTGETLVALPCGHRVTVLSVNASNWAEVETENPRAPGTTITGFVAGWLLRDPVSEARETLVRTAYEEWVRFDFGRGDETAPPYSDRIGEMWRAIDLSPTQASQHVANRIAWSAAAISWVVNQAASEAPSLAGFAASYGHHVYIKDAIKKREAGTNNLYWARRLDEAKPQIGDLVVQSRTTTKPENFGCGFVETYEDARRCSSFPSHCDLIVGIVGQKVYAFGGNVSNSFSLSAFDLDETGHLATTNDVYMMLQLQQ